MRGGGEDWGSGVGVGWGRGAAGSGGASFLGSDSPRALHALWKLPGPVGGGRGARDSHPELLIQEMHAWL